MREVQVRHEAGQATQVTGEAARLRNLLEAQPQILRDPLVCSFRLETQVRHVTFETKKIETVVQVLHPVGHATQTPLRGVKPVAQVLQMTLLVPNCSPQLTQLVSETGQVVQDFTKLAVV